MKKRYFSLPKCWLRTGLFTALTASLPLILQAQNSPAKLWDKTYGGNGIENLKAVRQTSDGGYILGGTSNSNINGDKSQASKGGEDYWIVKSMFKF